MKLNIPEDLRKHLHLSNKKGFYALYNFKDDVLYTVDYFDGRKFKCWLQINTSAPEVRWQRYGDARITSPLAYNVYYFFICASQLADADTFFFYLGE